MAKRKKKPTKKNARARKQTLATRPPLTPQLCQAIVIQNTPDAPTSPVDPETQLLRLGVIGDEEVAMHKSGIQSDLNEMGWHIKQADITSSPSTTVAACRNSVLSHAL
jgi:hypothetical protein